MSCLAAALGLLVRLLGWTWRVRWQGELPEGAFVLACLHGELLPLAIACRGQGMTPMISQSSDGELAARAVSWLGYPALRGSSSRGGAEALAAGVRLAQAGGRPALLVDGPRGPRGVPKPGAVRIAQQADVPLVALRARARPAWRAGSWDRALLPLPFARVDVEVARVASPEGPGALQRLALALTDAGPDRLGP